MFNSNTLLSANVCISFSIYFFYSLSSLHFCLSATVEKEKIGLVLEVLGSATSFEERLKFEGPTPKSNAYIWNPPEPTPIVCIFFHFCCFLHPHSRIRSIHITQQPHMHISLSLGLFIYLFIYLSHRNLTYRLLSFTLLFSSSLHSLPLTPLSSRTLTHTHNNRSVSNPPPTSPPPPSTHSVPTSSSPAAHPAVS